MATEEKSRTWLRRRYLWPVLGPLAVIIVLYSLYPESTIKKVRIPGIFEAEFETRLTPQEKIDSLPKEEVAQRQEGLKSRLQEAESRVTEATQHVPPPAGVPAVAGTWRTPNGISYIIEQSGAMITIREISPLYGITAVGQGTISGGFVNVNYTTLIGTTGSLSLQIASDRSLVGAYRDHVTGMGDRVVLTR